MKVITYADVKFNRMLDLTLAMNRAAGYQPYVYRPGSNFTVPGKYRGYRFEEWPGRVRGKLPWTPDVIRKGLVDFFDETVWLDADAFAVGPIEPVFEDKGFDLSVTLRRASERATTAYQPQYGYVNTGAMFFRYRPKTMRFIDLWISMVDTIESKSDQEAINLLLLQCDSLESAGRTIVHPCGARIKLLTTDQWNWYYWPEPLPAYTRIVHMKTDKRALARKWLKSLSDKAPNQGRKG